MAYTTAGAILELNPALPQTTSASGYTQTVTIVSSHITRADGIIDAKLARRYSVPFSTTPPLVRTLSQDITNYFVFRSFFNSDNVNRLEEKSEYYNMAMDTLNEIMKGNMDLVDTAGSVLTEVNADNVMYSTVEDYTPFFNVDDSTSWKFDSDLLDSVRSDRS